MPCPLKADEGGDRRERERMSWNVRSLARVGMINGILLYEDGVRDTRVNNQDTMRSRM